VLRAVLELVRPGITGRQLVQAAVRAAGGRRPWPAHFYLAHGTGTESAEMPLIGTDLGDAFDESVVLAPGMVLVFEPAIWDDGAGGYRAEEIVAVTAEGWVPLSHHSYAPYGADAGA
jgi:Xaa-Pro aminopeptidase